MLENVLENFQDPMEQFNYANLQVQQHNIMSKLTNGRKLGNKYHTKMMQLMDGSEVYNKLMERLYDNPKFKTRDSE